MIIVAILKHVAGKSADYGAALDYLKYEHDEVLKKPLLDANGNWVLRRDILLEGINCEPELFDVECEMLNAQYHKNQNYNEIKTHHYLISFDPSLHILLKLLFLFLLIAFLILHSVKT